MAADRLKREPLKTWQGRKLATLPDKLKPAIPTVGGRFKVANFVAPYAHRRWRRIRDRQLSLEPLCRACWKAGRCTAASVADHIVPHRGNVEAFWTGALQSLCGTCHSSLKQRQERAGEIG